MTRHGLTFSFVSGAVGEKGRENSTLFELGKSVRHRPNLSCVLLVTFQLRADAGRRKNSGETRDRSVAEMSEERQEVLRSNLRIFGSNFEGSRVDATD